MKDVSGWQLQLRKPGTYLHWPELAHQGQDFVVGQPRQGFEVVISAPPHAMQQAQLAMVGLQLCSLILVRDRARSGTRHIPLPLHRVGVAERGREKSWPH